MLTVEVYYFIKMLCLLFNTVNTVATHILTQKQNRIKTYDFTFFLISFFINFCSS